MLSYCFASFYSSLNFSYVVTSDIGSELSVRGNAMLVWPHVLETIEDNMIEFPTTTIGSSYVSQYRFKSVIINCNLCPLCFYTASVG